MGRHSGSKVRQRTNVVHVHAAQPEQQSEQQRPPTPGDILRKPCRPASYYVRYVIWVLLVVWAVASLLHARKLVLRTRAALGEPGTCTESCRARQPAIHTKAAANPSSSSSSSSSTGSSSRVLIGRTPVTPERGQQLHQQPALAPSLGPYPFPQFQALPDTGFEPPAYAELHADVRPNPYIVIAYNGSFFGHRWEDQQRLCPVPCFVSSDTAKWGARADILVFHAPTLDINTFLDQQKPPGQMWALHSMESASYYAVQGSSNPIMDRIDIQATPKLRPVSPNKLHVPTPYFNSQAYNNWTLQRPQMHNKTRLALWMHNACTVRSYREVLVAQLMRYLPIDSPGECLHNYDPPGAAHKEDPLSLLANYKFYLVFENAFGETDWVSSTFFRTLDAGTVPVYLGAPNILKFAPGERSVIRACDFNSMEELADYLLYLDSNNTAYMEYLSWKETGPSPEFQALMQVTEPSTFCSMCMAAAVPKLDAYEPHRQELVRQHAGAMQQFAQLNQQLQRERNVPCRSSSRWWIRPFSQVEWEELMAGNMKRASSRNW